MSQFPRPPRIKAPKPQKITTDISFGQRPQLVGSFTIGNSDPHDYNRRVDQGIKTTGWSGFVNGVVQQSIDDGFKRFSLHNPFGTLASQQMLASQYLAAKAANLPWLTDGFVEAWKPITAQYEVISYHGSIAHDENFENEWKAGVRSFTRYVLACYQPAIDAGMSVAFDAHLHLNPTHIAVAAERFLRQTLAKTSPKARRYFEPGPAAADWHWFKEGCNIWIANDNSAIVNDEAQDWQLSPVPDNTETILQLCMAPADIIAGTKYHCPAEYIEQWAGCTWGNYPTWIKRFCDYHFERGRTVAVNPRDFAKFGLKVKDVLPVVTT